MFICNATRRNKMIHTQKVHHTQAPQKKTASHGKVMVV